MSTKSPSPILEYSEDTIEKKIHTIAAEVPALEPNDQHRLAYCLWAWYVERKGTIQQAVHAAGVRSHLTEEQITEIVESQLKAKGLL